MLRRPLALAAVALATTMAPHAGAQDAARPNRAGLVVDNGDKVTKVCVHFVEPTIDGITLLQRASAHVQPVTAPFPVLGQAVCSLCGTGCPGDGSCLTCGGASYWSYARATAGASTFTPSERGAQSVQVRDGDVEGWRWGEGAPPGFVAIAEICDAPDAVVVRAGDASGTIPASQPGSGGSGSAAVRALGFSAVLAALVAAAWLARRNRSA